MKTIYLTEREFCELPEYSCSLPTGTTPGKRWRRNLNSATVSGNPPGLPPSWVMGEYFLDETIPAGQIGIRWSKIVIGALSEKQGALPMHLL